MSNLSFSVSRFFLLLFSLSLSLSLSFSLCLSNPHWVLTFFQCWMLRFILLRLKPNNVNAIFKAVYQCGSLNRWNLCRPKTMQCYFNFDASEIVSTKQKWLKNIQEVEHLQFLIRKIPSRNKSGSSFTRINYFHVNIENKSKKSFLHFIVLKIVWAM